MYKPPTPPPPKTKKTKRRQVEKEERREGKYHTTSLLKERPVAPLGSDLRLDYKDKKINHEIK